MSTSRRFAPISSEPSTRLRLAAGYLAFTGGLLALGAVAGLGAALLGRLPEYRVALLARPYAPLANLAYIAALLWTARALRGRSRRGGVAALTLFTLPLLARAAGQPLRTTSLVVALVGLLVVASVWSELGSARPAAG